MLIYQIYVSSHPNKFLQKSEVSIYTHAPNQNKVGSANQMHSKKY